MIFEKSRLKQSFNFPKDEVESYIQFMFLISSKPAYQETLERNRLKPNKSLALRNYIQEYICKHDDIIQANKSDFKRFREEFLSLANKSTEKGENDIDAKS